MNIVGIYKITSPTKKVYIGQSIDVVKRIWYYEKELCKKQALLYNSIKKYGWNKHKFEILCQCDESELNTLEVYYIELFQSYNSEYGLNLMSGGKAHGRHSDATKQKMREVHMGNQGGRGNKGGHLSEERKQRLRETHIGKKRTEEQKARMSEAQKGRPKMSEKTRELYRLVATGRVHSEESKRKMSESKKGKKRIPFSEEWKKNMGDAVRGRKFTEEHKRKIALAHTGMKRVKIIKPDLELQLN